tara:strand:- start:870 stop:1163 length:294 start_codon:yes stop_codon:yes gene_type:complete
MTAKNQSYGPQYYNRGSIEVWDFIRDQKLNYHLGNAIKYICRAGHKDDALSDLKKAIHYLTNERDYLLKESKRVSQGVLTEELYDEILIDAQYQTDI